MVSNTTTGGNDETTDGRRPTAFCLVRGVSDFPAKSLKWVRLYTLSEFVPNQN